MDPPPWHDYCILDIETTAGDFRILPAGFKLLFAGLKHQGQHYFYPSQPIHLLNLVEFLDYFQGTVVTFNGTRFDVPVLNQHLIETLGRKARIASHYDILLEITRASGCRISLAELAHLNLGRTKKPWNHAMNERVWRETPNRLIDYNKEDLDLTAAMYELILNNRPIRVGHRSILLRHFD